MTNHKGSQWEPLLKRKFLAHETHETNIEIIILFSSLHQLHKITITHVIMNTNPSYTFEQLQPSKEFKDKRLITSKIDNNSNT